MWRIGIDEAGYGPNFGPLVMSAVACQAPSELVEADFWEVLHPAVGRCARRGGHLFVDDSKKVYQPGKGLAGLERTVHAFLSCLSHPGCHTLADLLQCLQTQTSVGPMIDEPWYHGGTTVPAAAAAADIASGSQNLKDALAQAAVCWGPIYSIAIDTPRFNGIVDRHGSKGAALAVAVVQLLRACLAHAPADDGLVIIDKHGGRNFYAPILQELCPDAWVVPIQEGMTSVYEVRWPQRVIRVILRPEADATSFEVALASIVSKYIRELCMEEFNAFWKTHVPNVKATAGYPGDATRFLADIRPTLERMKLPMDRIWRKR